MVLPIGTTMNHPRRGLVKIEDTVLLADGLRQPPRSCPRMAKDGGTSAGWGRPVNPQLRTYHGAPANFRLCATN